MQAALKINSPSHVMRDDVGRWIPEGLAEGIRGNAASVYEEINRISAGVVKGGSPEMALGLNGMTAMSASGNVVHNYSNTQTTFTNPPEHKSVQNTDTVFVSELYIDSKLFAKTTAKPMRKELEKLDTNERIIMTARNSQ